MADTPRPKVRTTKPRAHQRPSKTGRDALRASVTSSQAHGSPGISGLNGTKMSRVTNVLNPCCAKITLTDSP